MKWQKLGKLFDPRDHQLVSGCVEFSQSPQAVVFPEHVRVYFSTRQLDDRGKFLSHVSFVDFDKSLNRILRVASHEVLPLGARGTFDEHGIFPISPLRVGSRIYAYTTGWTRRVSVSTDSGIGLAISDDGGETFVRHGQGPVLTASLHEPFLVSDGFVLQHDGQFHMWYIYGERWLRPTPDAVPDRVYKIAYALSPDGIHWTPQHIPVLDDRLGADECQALPSVLWHDGKFHMVFCYRHATDFRRNPSRGYRLGLASSTDMLHWHRDDGPVIAPGVLGDWDADMQCYPNLVEIEGVPHLFYNGSEFGRFGFGAARLASLT